MGICRNNIMLLFSQWSYMSLARFFFIYLWEECIRGLWILKLYSFAPDSTVATPGCYQSICKRVAARSCFWSWGYSCPEVILKLALKVEAGILWERELRPSWEPTFSILLETSVEGQKGWAKVWRWVVPLTLQWLVSREDRRPGCVAFFSEAHCQFYDTELCHMLWQNTKGQILRIWIHSQYD